jgi:hypothetical protein
MTLFQSTNLYSTHRNKGLAIACFSSLLTADEEVSIFMTGRINQKEITHGLAAMSGGKFGSKCS